MITLALDTSTNRGEIAVLKDAAVLARKSWVREKSHSELVTSSLEECLDQAKLTPDKIERIACGRGPGSFTGIRIAINLARTLAYSLGVPVFAFNTNEILAEGVPAKQTPLLTIVNAHKNLLYSALFTPKGGEWLSTHGPAAWTLEEINAHVKEPRLCVGDAFEEYQHLLPPELKSKIIRDINLSDFPQAEAIARLSYKKTAQPLVWKELQALYIRASEAEEKLREKP